MKKLNSKQKIIQQNHQILNNIKRAEIDDHKASLQKRGHILLADAKEQGFRKVGYDVFQRKEDIDAGNIWSVESIDGEQWLVCYTDQNDRILRNLKGAAKNHRMNKTAAIDKKAVVMYVGDLVEITPRHAESVHNKYKGLKGEVTASMPDRSQLTFDDGNSFWIENTDLTVVKDRRELDVGDTVRMFSRRDIGGKVVKFSHNNEYITFESKGNQRLTARRNDLCKITKTGLVVQNIFTDPANPNENKLLKEYMKGMQTSQPEGLTEPQPGMETAPETAPELGNQGKSMDNGGFPPSIKANPSQTDIAAGTSIPASQFANTVFTGIVKQGRQLNIGDTVKKKDTGDQGTIVEVSFDKKLGKFYMVNFGAAQEPELIYDTNIMKVRENAALEEAPSMGLPTDSTPMRQSDVDKNNFSKAAVLDPKFDEIKTAALEFVEGMSAQALKNHEATSPGISISDEFENEIIKQAITMYMSKYLPTDFRQMLSAEDKNELSQWLYDTSASSEAPTTAEFAQPSSTPEEEVDIWDLSGNYANTLEATQDKATQKLSNELKPHVKVALIKPTEFFTLRDKQKFVRDAVYTMSAKGGMLTDAAHLIAQHIVSFADINWPVLRHSLFKMGYKNVDQVLETAGDVLAFTPFRTSTGQKYALDLPGMETLRGGGGGYPGGMDVDPMGWQVKNPNSAEEGAPDQEQLQSALQENLSDQSVPFEQTAPKINIELDPESKKITIDYGQEEEPPIELAGEEQLPEGAEETPPGATGPGAGPQPGQTGGQPQTPDGGAEDFGGMDIPTNF